MFLQTDGKVTKQSNAPNCYDQSHFEYNAQVKTETVPSISSQFNKVSLRVESDVRSMTK